jgi:2-oxoglutarate dehydrogenase E2 component (dihydrolipoamide succinyltransferase)
MPKMGESITEGTIIEWRKKVGDSIEKDEILLEIGTDKVDSEIPSTHTGTIVDLLADPNQVVEVGIVIAKIATEGEIAGVMQEESTEIVKDSDGKLLPDKQIKSEIKQKTDTKITKKFYTPVVLKIASEEGISFSVLEEMNGSGRGGRVTKKDILSFINVQSTAPVRNGQQSRSLSSTVLIDNQEELSYVRKRIAQHMRSSLDTAAHVFVTTEVDVTNIVNFVKQNGKDFYDQSGFKLTYTSFILYETINALMQTPDMNASLENETIIYHKNVNLGMAVAMEKGLMVPVILNSQNLNFFELCVKINDLAIRTRDKKINPDELQDSTFTVTNFGVFNVTTGYPIINQPNVGILGVGTIKKRPVVLEKEDGDSIAIRSILNLSLSFDHRLIDGAGGSMFIDLIRKNLEEMDLQKLM